MIKLGPAAVSFLAVAWLFASIDPSLASPAGPVFAAEAPLPTYQCAGELRKDAERDGIVDTYYRFVNWIAVDVLSRRFPIEELFSAKSEVAKVPDGWTHSLKTKQSEWLSFERGWLAFAIVFVAFAAIFTIAYSIYRCCCSKPKDSDKPPNKMKRNVVGMLVCVFIVVLFYTVFLMFSSSLYFKRGAQHLLPTPQKVDVCANDAELFRQDLIGTLKRLTDEDLDAVLGDASSNGGLQRTVQAKVLQQVDELLTVIELDKGIALVKPMLELPEKMTAQVDALIALLKKIQSDCDADPLSCAALSGSFDFNAAIVALEDVKTQLAAIDLTPAREIVDKASDPNDKLGINAQIDNAMKQVNAAEIKKKIQEKVDEILKQIKDVKINEYKDKAHEKIDKIRPDYRLFSAIAYWTFVGVSVFFLIIAIIFLIGCTFDTCGKKAEKGCCLRSSSAVVYGIATWISLLGMVLLAVAITIIAILGGNAANLVCDPLHHPLERTDVLAVANEFWLEKTQSVFAQTANTGFSIRQPELVGVLRACTNQPVYGLFEIDRQIDALLAPMIDEAKQEIAEFKLGDLTRLLDDADRKLRPVETQIKAAKDKMDAISKKLPTSDVAPTAGTRKDLDEARAIVAEATHLCDETLSTFGQLRQWAATAKGRLATMVTTQNLAAFAEHTIGELIGTARGRIETYAGHVDHLVKHRMCAPLRELAEAVTVAACDQLVDPLNGVWHSVFSSLVFISILILLTTQSSRLARQKPAKDPQLVSVKPETVEIHVSSAPLEPNANDAHSQPTHGPEADEPSAANGHPQQQPQGNGRLYPSVDLSEH